ncbi:HAD family hydrolase [Cerasicoccus maritimus]|uniref:HAD family hydrolase n=1 Tax=Cerasicoccus maritimus TaxID=490089 RepID=UPI00285281BB|nr:HAD family phosphatase [Cerasicoccus maritimus]
MPSMQQLASVRGVIFDMDGLLLDTERIFKKAYQRSANQHGIVLQDDVYDQMIGLRSDASQRVLREALGPSAPSAAIIEGARHYYYMQIEEEGIPLRPGVLEMFDYIESLGFPMTVATSTHHELAMIKLRVVGLLDRVVGIVSGDQVAKGKPEPDIYQAAAKLIGVEPEHCLALEDSPPGVIAARKANCVTIMIPDLQAPNAVTRSMANFIYESLHDVVRELKNARAAELST